MLKYNLLALISLSVALIFTSQSHAALPDYCDPSWEFDTGFCTLDGDSVYFSCYYHPNLERNICSSHTVIEGCLMK